MPPKTMMAHWHSAINHVIIPDDKGCLSSLRYAYALAKIMSHRSKAESIALEISPEETTCTATAPQWRLTCILNFSDEGDVLASFQLAIKTSWSRVGLRSDPSNVKGDVEITLSLQPKVHCLHQIDGTLQGLQLPFHDPGKDGIQDAADHLATAFRQAINGRVFDSTKCMLENATDNVVLQYNGSSLGNHLDLTSVQMALTYKRNPVHYEYARSKAVGDGDCGDPGLPPISGSGQACGLRTHFLLV